MNPRYAQYRCVRCGGELFLAAPVSIQCGSCPHSYPVIGEVPILTLRPVALVAVAVQALRTTATKIRNLSSTYDDQTDIDSLQVPFRRRAERALAGMRANLALTETYLKPAESLIREHNPQLDFLDRISNCGGGWSPEEMLPYFYQDWGGTQDFAAVRTRLLDAVLQHRSDAEAVAVLGAGACGLVQALAPEFEYAYGVDLSLATLLIARGVLSGDTVVVHLDQADWRTVELRNREPPSPNVRLLVADAADLPFADNSISAVVTQYMLDVVGNADAIAREIHRVLKPGGIWFDFSRPPRLSTQPDEFGRRSLEELPSFLQPNGLRLIDSSHVRFTLLNLTAISPDILTVQHDVHAFIARRAPGGVEISATGDGTRFHGDDAGWWRQVPEVAALHRVCLASAKTYSPGGPTRHNEISFGQGRCRVSADDAHRLESVLELIDGKRTIREIYARFVAQGFETNSAEFRELLHYLDSRHGAVRLGTRPQ